MYNYHECYKWCRENLPRPSVTHAHTGTWGCNGEYVWWCYANGEADPYRSSATQTLDLRHKDYRGVPGSSCMYSFSAVSDDAPLVKSRLMPCFCSRCRNSEFHLCFFRRLWRMNDNTCELKATLSIDETKERSKGAREKAKERKKRRAERINAVASTL